jgi:hypothetical protein
MPSIKACLLQNLASMLIKYLSQSDQLINDERCKPYSDEEIKEALFQMCPTKAPGPDGSLPCSIKNIGLCWGDIVMWSDFFLTGEDVSTGLCDTVIVLIPKKLKLKRLTNLWPINLCNVLYKIAPKVLANRVKGVLPSIIAEEQSAFIPGRLITDNVLIA